MQTNSVTTDEGRAEGNMADKYWEEEKPVTVVTSKNVLMWYRQSQKLQVSRPNWTTEDGQSKQGKTVTLDLKALVETPEGRDMLVAIAETLK